MVGARGKERVTLACALALAVAYVLVSAQVAFWVWLDFCDTAEQDCSRPWDAARITRWAAWVALGLAVGVLLRYAARQTRRSGRSVNAVSLASGLGIAAGLLLAAAAWWGHFPV